jgi:predicted ATPase/class 3 adenylate cyclase
MSSGALTSYLPPRVRRRLRDGLPELPLADTFEGALLIADISGFTRLTEQMARRGREAVETLRALINGYFDELIDRVDLHGGEVMSFTGDGLIAVWPDSDGADLAEQLHRAAACAIELAQTTRDTGAARLTVRVGVSVGSLRALELGGLHGRRFNLLGGVALDAASLASEAAGPAQVVVNPDAWPLLARHSRGEPGPHGVRVLELDPPPASRHVESVAAPAELLAPYIPPPVMSREGIGQGDWLAEIRRVTVVFVNLPGIDHVAEPELVHQAVLALQREFDRHEATINSLGVDSKGTSVVAATGLPPLSHDDDPVRAVRAAMAVAQSLAQERWRAGIGVATGRAFCGPLGNQSRREYAIAGDVVNTAARLTQRALAESLGSVTVLCCAATERATRQRIGWGKRQELELKGKADLVAAYSPVRLREAGLGTDRGTVGRHHERGVLHRLVRERAGGDARVVVLEGEPGMGKSRLLHEALAEAGAQGLRSVIGVADPIEHTAPYHAWRPVFTQLLGVADVLHPRDRGETVLGSLPLRFRPLAPLLNLILGLELPDTTQTEELQGERRIQATRRLLLDLTAHAAEAPLLIAIDDAHWLDSASWGLLLELISAELSICIVLATRPGAGLAPEYEELLAEPSAQLLTLGPLGAQESLEIASDRLVVAQLPEEVAELVVEKAAGNPLFSEELAYALRDSGLVEIVDGGLRLTAGGDLASLVLPDSVEGIIGSRIDRLEPQPELCLKLASAVGPTFGRDVIHDIYPLAADRDLVDRYLDTLVRRDLTVTVPQQASTVFAFRHALTREVAYNRMLYSQRRELHRSLALWYEQHHADNLEPVLTTLAHHWTEAGEVEKACEYLELASDQAVNNGMSREAVNLGLRSSEMRGVAIPRTPEAIAAAIGATLESIGALMAGRDVESLANLPPAEDPRRAAAIGALLRVEPAVFLSQQAELFALVGLRSFELTLEHGATPFTPGVIAIYAMIVRALDANPQYAFALSSLAVALAERDSPPLRAYTGFVHHWFIKHWLEPLGPELDQVRQNSAAGFEWGDVMFGCFNTAAHVVQLAASGAPLNDVVAVGKAGNEAIAGRVASAAFHTLHETQLAKALAGRTVERCSFTDHASEGTIEEERDVASITRTDLYNQIGYYMTSKLRLHLLYREYRRAVSYGERAERTLPSFAGQAQEAEFTFLFALALFARHGESEDPDKLAHARDLLERVRGWERHAPRVFAHKVLAIEAAQARVQGDDARAADLFARAAESAAEIGFDHHVAFAYELSGRCLIEAGELPHARERLLASRAAYARWGAHAKVADVDEALAGLPR